MCAKYSHVHYNDSLLVADNVRGEKKIKICVLLAFQ